MKRSSACALIVVSLLSAAWQGHAATAYQTAAQESPAALPNSPVPNAADTAAPTSTDKPGAVRGEVTYPDKAPLAGAQLVLTPASGPAIKALTEADGTFVFEQVPPGSFTLQITANDVEPAMTSGTVQPGAALELPELTMRLAVVHTDVTAITQHEAAEREVREEEGQRILKAIPNFLVVYDAEPVPLSTGQKFRLSWRTAVDPMSFGVSAAIAAGEQKTGSYPGFGTGVAGYGRRFGAAVGDGTIGTMLASAVLPTIFHQDPRYYYRGTGSRSSRMMYVLRQAVEQKGDNGRWQFAWSNTLGSVGSALISDTYYPHTGHQWGSETMQLTGLSILSNGIANAMQEFVFGRITSRRSH